MTKHLRELVSGAVTRRSTTIIIHLPAIKQLGTITAIIVGFVSDARPNEGDGQSLVMAFATESTIKRLADPPVIVDPTAPSHADRLSSHQGALMPRIRSLLLRCLIASNRFLRETVLTKPG